MELEELKGKFNLIEQNLRDKYGNNLWSISKFNSIAQCPQQYYLTYIARKKQEANVYNVLGNIVHKNLQLVYDDKIDMQQAFLNFVKEYNETIGDFAFMSENVRDSWFNNVKHFFMTHKKPKGNYKVLTEQICLYLNDELNIAVRGYIDMIILHEDGTLEILDWKTSSKFSGQKLTDAGRQLIIYKLAVEQMTGLKVKTIKWNMIKYCKVTYTLASGKKSTKIEERKNLSKVPNVMFVTDYVLEYSSSEAKTKEVIEFMKEQLEKLEILDGKGQLAWQCNGNDFFCSNLCGHKKNCPKFATQNGAVDVDFEDINDLQEIVLDDDLL